MCGDGGARWIAASLQVSYNVHNWVDKNKDNVNESVIEVLRESIDNDLVRSMWENFETTEESARRGLLTTPGQYS